MRETNVKAPTLTTGVSSVSAKTADHRNFPRLRPLKERIKGLLRRNSKKYLKNPGIALGCSPVKHSPELIVSLTSYPTRIGTVHKTIETILCQTERPDRVILWLAPEQFPKAARGLPRKLKRLTKYGLEIQWYHDIKSYKKLIPALHQYPDAIIVTADDNVYYDSVWLEKLYDSWKTHPNHVHVHRTTQFYLESGEFGFVPQKKYQCPSYLHMPVGIGGVLYPPHCLHPDVLKEELFMQYARTNDDLWFWFMAVRNHYKILPVDKNLPTPRRVEGTQDADGLSEINDHGSTGFKVDLQCLFEHYPEVDSALRRDYVVVCEYKRCSALSREQRNQSYYAALPPEHYEANLIMWYRRCTKQWLNLDRPVTYNEKLQWLKLFDATPLKSRLTDKYEVRDWIAEKIGEKYLIPSLGVWNSFDEIDFDKLPKRFVLKATHGSGWNVIVPDKSMLNMEEAKQNFDLWMKKNFAYDPGLELQYLPIPPRIVAEEYLENDNRELYDYKVFCFDGKADSIVFVSGRATTAKYAFFDMNWNKLPYYCKSPIEEREIPKPPCLEKLIELAETLSKGFATVRVDFYILNDGTIKFGEMTFTAGNGICVWHPQEQNLILGNLIKLPEKSPFPQKPRSLS